MTSQAKKIPQVIISSILLAILLYNLDLDQLKRTFTNVDYFYLLICLMLPFSNRILMPAKWNLLLRAKNIYVPWFQVIQIYYISSFLGTFLPPTVGSDSVRAYYISKRGHQLSDVISSILVERVIGLIGLLVLGMIAALLFLTLFSQYTFDLGNVFLFIALSFIVITGSFLLSLSDWISSYILNFTKRFTEKKIIGKSVSSVRNFYQSYILYKRKKGTLLLFFMLTLLEISLRIGRCYIIALTINTNIQLSYFFAFVPIILVAVRLPISLSGFGIHEGGFVYFLSLVDISKTSSFTIGIIDHLIVLYAVLPGALFYVFGKRHIHSEEEPVMLNDEA